MGEFEKTFANAIIAQLVAEKLIAKPRRGKKNPKTPSTTAKPGRGKK
jgi:hypothetical protein